MFVLGFDIPLWVALTTIVGALIYWYGTSTYGAFRKMGVPYRPAYIPFIGHMLEMMTVPIDILEKRIMEKRFPVKFYGYFEGRTPMLALYDVEFIKQVTIKEFGSFTNRRDIFQEENIITNNVTAIKDDYWKHVRSILTPTFTSGKLKQMYPVINSCADKFVKHLRSTSAAPMAIKDYTSGYTMDVIASTAFGLDIDVQSTTNHPFVTHGGSVFGIPKDDKVSTKIRMFLTLFILFVAPPSLRKFINFFVDINVVETGTLGYFEGLFNKILDETQEQLQHRNDFISMCSDKLVDLEEVDKESIRVTGGRKWTTQGLTRKDVLGNALVFLTAGYETTASALQYFFYIMAVHPGIQQRLYDSITDVVDQNGDCAYEELKKLEYLDWCVSEALRIFPPVNRVDRVATDEVTIQGVTIPAGMVVNLMIYTVHHHPEYWPDPWTYNPDRFSPENKTDIQQNAYMPFGAGNRNCIAMRLALLEVKVAVVKTMMSFRFEKTSETPEIAELKFKPGIGFLQVAPPLKISAVPRDETIQ